MSSGGTPGVGAGTPAQPPPHEAIDQVARLRSKAAVQAGERAPRTSKRSFQPYHARVVPKCEDLRVATASGALERGPVTTMMLRNIPNKYSQNTMMAEIDEVGFAGSYDFFYLPMDIQNRSSVGYAFINFVSPAMASRFFEIFSEHRFRRHTSNKVSKVSAAHMQGLHANLRHFANRAVAHAKNGQYRPVVLNGGERVDFDTAVELAVAAEKRSEAARPKTRDSMDVARLSLEKALQTYLLSRQVSEDSNTSTASSAGVPSPLQGLVAPPWRPPTPGACLPPMPPAAWLVGPPSGLDALAAQQHATSQAGAEDSAGLSVGAPAYVPLPTIPSASKIFSACHDEASSPLEEFGFEDTSFAV